MLTLLIATLPPLDWTTVLQRVADKLPVWKLGNEQRDLHMVHQALVDLGYRKAKPYDFDGIDCPTDRVVPIRGADGFVALFRGPQPDEAGCVAIFLRKGTKFEPQIIETASTAYSLNAPLKATMNSNRLLIAGLYEWLGNWPRTSLELYEPAKAWHKLASVHTEIETWSVSGIYTDGSKSYKPIRIVSRTYPKNLICSHASAMTSLEEQWRVVGEAFRFDWRRLRPTAFNAMDKLYGALQQGDRNVVRSFCANKALADQIWSVRTRTTSGSPYADDLDGRFLETTRIGIGNLKLAFHFVKLHGRYVVGGLSKYEGRE
jgi:hypothetical protein